MESRVCTLLRPYLSLCILIPAAENIMDVAEINSMIREINETQVAEEEILSDRVYAYDSICKEIYIAGQDRVSELKKDFCLQNKGEPAKEEQQKEKQAAYAR